MRQILYLALAFQCINHRVRSRAFQTNLDVAHDDRYAGLKYKLRRMRILINVKLCTRKDISRAAASPHERNTLDLFLQLRPGLQKYRDVRQRSKRYDRDLFILHCHLMQKLHCMLIDRLYCRLR